MNNVLSFSRFMLATKASNADYVFSVDAAGIILYFPNGGQNTLKLNGVSISSELVGINGAPLNGKQCWQYVGELKIGDTLSANSGGFNVNMLIAVVSSSS